MSELGLVRLGLVLERKTARDIITLALQQAPHEMCGLLLARQDSNYCTEFRAIENIHEDPQRYYRMHPDTMTRVWEYACLNGMDIAGIVHSHPHGVAYPSSTDVRLAAYEDIPYVIVSTKPRDMKAFILNGAYKEIKIWVELEKAGLDYCWAHGQYEDTLGAFQVCYECGHAYKAEQNLIDEYNKVLAELDAYDKANPREVMPLEDWDALMSGYGEQPLLVTRTRAELGDKVWTCPMCSHDF